MLLGGRTLRKAVAGASEAPGACSGSVTAAGSIASVVSSGVPAFPVPFSGATGNAAHMAFLNQFALESHGKLIVALSGAGTVLEQIASLLNEQSVVRYTSFTTDGQAHTLGIHMTSAQGAALAHRSYLRCGGLSAGAVLAWDGNLRVGRMP